MSRVLLVEDEPDIRMLTRMMLEDAQHEVSEAPNAEVALELLRQPGAFDVVLLDLRLPGRSGWDVLAEMKAATVSGQLRIVVLSAQIGPADMQRARQEGAAGYITKPFTESELLAAVGGSALTP